MFTLENKYSVMSQQVNGLERHATKKQLVSLTHVCLIFKLPCLQFNVVIKKLTKCKDSVVDENELEKGAKMLHNVQQRSLVKYEAF